LHVFFFQAEDGIRDATVTGVQTCALPIYREPNSVLAQRVRIQAQQAKAILQRGSRWAKRDTGSLGIEQHWQPPRLRAKDLVEHEIGRASCRERGWRAEGVRG